MYIGLRVSYVTVTLEEKNEMMSYEGRLCG